MLKNFSVQGKGERLKGLSSCRLQKGLAVTDAIPHWEKKKCQLRERWCQGSPKAALWTQLSSLRGAKAGRKGGKEKWFLFHHFGVPSKSYSRNSGSLIEEPSRGLRGLADCSTTAVRERREREGKRREGGEGRERRGREREAVELEKVQWNMGEAFGERHIQTHGREEAVKKMWSEASVKPREVVW